MGPDADVPVGRLSLAPETINAAVRAADLAALPGIILRQWKDETACLVFVPQSNSTHLVTSEAGQALRAAQQGVLDLAATDPAIVSGLLSAGLLLLADPT